MSEENGYSKFTCNLCFTKTITKGMPAGWLGYIGKNVVKNSFDHICQKCVVKITPEQLNSLMKPPEEIEP